MVPVNVELCPDASKAIPDAGKCPSYQGVKQVVGVLDFHHVGMPGLVESSGGQYQDRGVDQQGQGQGADGVDTRQFDRVLFAGQVFADQAGLHHRAVQIEVMGHHRGTQDTDGQVQRCGIADG
jgi:hypothetical protein